MLKNPKIAQSQREKLISSLLSTIEKTIDMLQDFIEMERFKKTKFLKNEKFSLKTIIEEIIKELEIDIERKKISLYLRTDEAEYVKTNKEWLKKALFNIIHNSIKYNKENGELFISVNKEKNGYMLTIKDTGIGMSEEEKKKIFKKYYTSGKDHGTGIGLNMSKAVIESIGGAIAIESEKDKGSKFFIYLPKTARQIKIRQLATALSGIAVFLFFSLDYFYCLIPQKIIKESSDNSVIYKLQNRVVARTDKNDKLKIIAYRNIFNTRTRTKFILKKADIAINTASNPIEVIANGEIIKNHGTEFETVTDKNKLATSVYKGSIRAGNTDVMKNEGLVYKKNRLIKENLPAKVTNVTVTTDKNYNTDVSWDSPYKNFVIILSRNKNFSSVPLIKLSTSKKYLSFDMLEDGKWYISVQSEKESLFSIPAVKTFLSLKNYEKALQAFNQGDLSLADTLLNISLSTIGNDSYKPYLLKSEISLKSGSLFQALEYAKKAYKIAQNDKTKYELALVFYKKAFYLKSINLLKTVKNKDVSALMAFNYYKLGDFKNAKKYLYKTLETDPENKEALRYMINIQKKEHNRFLLQYFKEQLKELK
jgi:tetratricopeptide (TPR) repeat protein